jgi:hypothetical protein
MVLNIEKDKIAEFRDSPEHLRGGEPRCFHGPVYTGVPEPDKQLPGKTALGQYLPPGEGNPAAGFLVKNPVLEANFHHLVQGIGPPRRGQSFAGTGGDTIPAAGTAPVVYTDPVPRALHRPLGTDLETPQAMTAFSRIPEHPDIQILGLRV